MGLFSKKMQTEEQRYWSSAQRRNAEAAAADRASDDRSRAARIQHEERQAAKARAKPRVRKVGTLRKIGRGQFETHGWEIEVTDGSVSGQRRESNARHDGTLYGLTVQELCAMAHGASCRCTR